MANEQTAPEGRNRPPRVPEVRSVPGPPIVPREMLSETARPDMRAPMRAEDSRALAEKRAAEIRGHIGELDEGIDEFAAPEAPDGWVYNWKRHTVHNMPDPSYASALARRGWEPVPAARHPEMVPSNEIGGAILRKGNMLMMRPKVINDEAKAAELRKARNEVRQKELQLGAARPGEFERKAPSIKRQFEPIPVPEG